MKTAHRHSNRRHNTSYGANARHISDMSDLDANYFLLLGGQDGWIGSANFDDQVPLWLRGEYLKLPLSAEGVKTAFPHVTRLTPG